MAFLLNFKYFIIIIFIFLNCDIPITEWEDVHNTHNPELNVLAIISMDPKIESFVSVYRTLNIDEPSELFVGETLLTYIDFISGDTLYSWVDSLYERTGLVDDAVVTVSDESKTYNFHYVESEKVYKDTLNQFFPNSNMLYKLSVESVNYNSISGELITPLIPSFNLEYIDSLYPDYIIITDDYWLPWNSIPYYGVLSASPIIDSLAIFSELGEEISDETNILCEVSYPCCNKISKMNIYQQVDLSNDGIIVDNIRCGKKGNASILYKLTSMDENYYNYFVANEGVDYSNFLLDSQGSDGRSVGVKGGLGLFGAIGSDTVSISIKVE